MCVMKPVSGECTGLERPCKAGEGAWPHLKGNQSSWGIRSEQFWEDRAVPARCSFLIPHATTPPGNRWLGQREPIHRRPNALSPIRCSLKNLNQGEWLSQETSQLKSSEWRLTKTCCDTLKPALNSVLSHVDAQLVFGPLSRAWSRVASACSGLKQGQCSLARLRPGHGSESTKF